MTPIQITHSPIIGGVGNEYSSMCPFSQDSQWLLLVWLDGRFGLYSGTGQFSAFLPNAIDASSRPRWSRTDPNTLTYLDANRIVSSNVTTMTPTVIREFTEYSIIDDAGEADISLDGDHRVLVGNRVSTGIRDVFVFTLSTKTKSPVFAQSLPFDGLKILGSNHPVLSRASDPRNPATDGIYDLLGIRISSRDSHAVPIRYQGKDYLVTQADPDKGISTNAIVRVDCETGKETMVFDMGSDWDTAFHIAACDAGGFVIISTYAAQKSGRPSQIWKVPLDGSAKTMVCNTGTVLIPSASGPWPYAPQPKAAVSRDGSRVVFCSNGGQVSNPAYSDAYLVMLAAVETRIDYSAYAGKKTFTLRPRDGFTLTPRPDGGCDFSGVVDVFEKMKQ